MGGGFLGSGSSGFSERTRHPDRGRSGGSSRLAAAGRLWLEDHAAEDQSETLELLFADYILPWCGTMLGKVEAHAHTPFWRTMAPLTRDAIAAMWDELQEEDEQ